MIYNVSMKIQHLLESPAAVEIFDRFLPGMRKMAEGNPQAAQLSVEQLVKYTRNPKAGEIITAMDAALNELNTPENAISPSEAKLIEGFRAILEEEKACAKTRETCHHQDMICPGQPWLDTKGDRIQAHGGAVYYENGTYYWYGENKTYTDGKNGIWTWGLKVYASQDLANWEDLGYLIPPVIEDPNSALFPTKRVDRPHILKCDKTGKYVIWIKLSGPEAAFTIWQSDALLGPYTMVTNLYNPGGHKAGDFDLIKDEENGKAYIYFDSDHECMLCMELSEDYTQAVSEVARNYPNMTPPFTREAPALFETMGKKYMITSGMTGYVPNRSDAAVCDSWDQVFTSIGDPHVEDASCASFNSQISKIFKVEGKENLFVAMADRWLVNTPVDAELADIFTRVIGSVYDPKTYQATDEERAIMYRANELETAPTQIADYVWLPITWKGDMPQIIWREQWSMEDFV